MKRTKNMLKRKLKKKYNFKNAFHQFNNQFISPYGGYIDIMNFANLLGLNKLVEKHFRLSSNPHRVYTDAKLFQRLLDTVILDIDRIDNADLFYNDPLLRYLETTRTDPSPSTLRRELKSCNDNIISSIESINKEFLYNCSPLQTKQNVTLLIDQTPIDLYGNQEGAKKGFNRFKSDVCYQAMVSAIKETSDVINLNLEPGDFNPSCEYFIDLVEKTINMLPPHLNIDKVRVDSGLFSFPAMDILEKKGLEYFIKGRISNNPRLIETASNVPEDDWIKPKDRDNYWISRKQMHYSRKYEKYYPVIFIRQPKEDSDPQQEKLFKDKTYEYFAIFSNSSVDEMSIWNFYNDGAIIELIIKELKNEFFLNSVPTSKFDANHAFIKIKALAYNILNAFKRLVLKGKWITKSAKTIRNRIIRVPVIVTAFRKGFKLNMAKNIKLEQFVTSISDKVYALACSFVT